jgi:hypothetical protein
MPRARTAPDIQKIGRFGLVAISRMGSPGVPIEATNPPDVRTIERRMLSFVCWHGEIPKEAHRASDSEFIQHPAIRGHRHLADGPGGAEVWGVEAFSSDAQNWTRGFIYEPTEDRWRSVLSDGSRNN